MTEFSASLLFIDIPTTVWGDIVLELCLRDPLRLQNEAFHAEPNLSCNESNTVKCEMRLLLVVVTCPFEIEAVQLPFLPPL